MNKPTEPGINYLEEPHPELGGHSAIEVARELKRRTEEAERLGLEPPTIRAVAESLGEKSAQGS